MRLFAPDEPDFNEGVEELAKLLSSARRVAFLTGAGISTDSGIPDFRSSTGLYQTTSEELFSIDAFRADPERFYRAFASFYAKIADARPNPGHLAIANLENRLGKKVDVVTQNVDGLHSAAGSTNVAEIHGTLRTASCLECEKRYARDYFETDLREGRAPRCACGGVLKPDVTFFGEELPAGEFAKARRAMWDARLLLVVGTSLQVYPAAGLPRDCDAGAPFVSINLTPTALDPQAALVFRAPIIDVLPRAVALTSPEAP
ncbi:MAG: NAD-dependent deacylase [Thermoguttaceae bacterium]|nr:NAD-dependent deacylase [Thermoguttaceae bacterium]